MNDIVIVAALANNAVIGIHGRLPWHLPEDLRHFKALTIGHTVIMGRKTWESLPEKFRPLPGRHNIVVTRNRHYTAVGAQVAHSLEEALAVDGLRFVIGGAELYQAALPKASRLELTCINADYAGDAFFPPLDMACWQETPSAWSRSQQGLEFRFRTLYCKHS